MCRGLRKGNGMSVFRVVGDRVGHLADGARRSVGRARLEGELRSLQRARMRALAALGERVDELVRSGAVSDAHLGAQLADVRQHDMLIAAKQREMARDEGPTVDVEP